MIPEEYMQQINDCDDEITNILSWTNKNVTDSLVKYLSAYCVVRASGEIEVVFKRLIFDYLSNAASMDTKNYLSKKLIDSSDNPSTGKIKSILQDINGTKASDFETELGKSHYKEQLNSLVQLRNDVAHGRSITTGLSTIYKYWKSGTEILKILSDILDQKE